MTFGQNKCVRECVLSKIEITNMITQIKFLLKSLLLISFVTLINTGYSQELNATVNVVKTGALTANESVLQDIENIVKEFLNERTWTKLEYKTHEKIECTFQINIAKETTKGQSLFEGSLLISSTRPTFGSDYKSRLFVHNETEFNFKYEPGRPIQFSENRFDDNLGSLLAYYAYIIIGMDYDSFGLMAGEPYFQKAQEIVDLAKNVGYNNGWFADTDKKNRYWLVQNFLDSKYRKFRQGIYKYHREGLDIMSKDVIAGRKEMADALSIMEAGYNNSPNQMLYQMFSNSKAEEVVNIYKVAPTYSERNKVLKHMQKFDPSKARILKELK